MTSVRGALDAPADGAALSRRRVTVSGWAVVDDAPARAVIVLLDGEIVGAAATGANREDVVEAIGMAGAARAGFSCDVDLHSLPNGPDGPDGSVGPVGGALGEPPQVMSLSVAALGEDGTLSPAFARATVRLHGSALRESARDSRLEGIVDVPAAGSVVGAEVVGVEGWAVYGGKPVLGVFVRCDDLPTVRARHLDRADVGENLGDNSLRQCGFRAEVDLRSLAGHGAKAAEVEVSVLVDEGIPGAMPDVSMKHLASFRLLVDGGDGGDEGDDGDGGNDSGMPGTKTALDRLRGWEPPEESPVVMNGGGTLGAVKAQISPTPLRESASRPARADSEIGLPLRKGEPRRLAGRVAARLSWPFLRRQIEFNKAVLDDLDWLEGELGELRGALERVLQSVERSVAANDRSVQAALDGLARGSGWAIERRFRDLAGELDLRIAELRDALHLNDASQRGRIDLLQRQTFERHHEDLGALRSELAEIGMQLAEVRETTSTNKD